MTFPAINIALQGYGWAFTPAVSRTVFASNNTRQRKRIENNNDTFSVTHYLTNAELSTFESYITTDLNGGADTDTMPYFASDAQSTGEAFIVNGSYSISYLQPDLWGVSYSMELVNRDLTDEQNVYESINALGGFTVMYDWIQALDDLVTNYPL